MKNTRAFVLSMVILLVLSLAACVQSIPGSKTKPTATGAAAVTPGTAEVMDQIYLFATQTKLAAQGLPQETPAPGGLTPVAPQASGTVVASSPTPEPTKVMLIPPTATPGLPDAYTIHKGEFPYCIARRFNLNPTELLNLNGLSSAAASSLSAGTTLKIPKSGSTFPGNRALRAHPTSYVVHAGDTIYSIACLFGDVDPSAIAYVNGLSEPYKLSAGQTLQIP